MYFQTHQEQANVGWFTRFLWKNQFLETVHNVKDRIKQLRQIEVEIHPEPKFEFQRGNDDEPEETYL